MDGGTSINPVYEYGSRFFDKAIIHLNKDYYSGNDFIIETINNSSQNRYIQSATLNGKPLNVPRLFHSRLVQGGVLQLIIGPKPNIIWESSENVMKTE
jgi:putative alpha-1,2-mannosidase